MSEPWDKAVKLRNPEDVPLIRDALEVLAGQQGACHEEAASALDACRTFDASPKAEDDWMAFEVALTALQQCTEDPVRNPSSTFGI